MIFSFTPSVGLEGSFERLRMKPYCVTIQMIAVTQDFHMVLFMVPSSKLRLSGDSMKP